jgi:hypothetical protein
MDENLVYALIQVAHNFGAVIVMGGAVYGRSPTHAGRQAERGIAWLVLAGWLVQLGSGAAFGAASYYNYGQLPDIHGVAVAALLVKIACAVVGVAMIVVWLGQASRGLGRRLRERMWTMLVALAATALVAAAFLRWFS